MESESNLSFEPDDTAWIFDDAIACNDAYVDKGAVLRGEAVVCDNAYISMGAVLSGHARVEDNAYIRGAVLSASARASGFSMILNDKDTMGVPILSGHCAVYGKVGTFFEAVIRLKLTGNCLHLTQFENIILIRIPEPEISTDGVFVLIMLPCAISVLLQ